MTDISYDEKPENYFHHERREMLAFVPPTATRVLEIGCGEGLFAAALKRERQLEIVGIEPFYDAVQKARTRMDEVHHTDIEQGLAQLKHQTFDCVVCNDVLEHLVDPWKVLSDLHPLLHPGASVVASIPNVRYMPVLKSLVLQGRWEYEDAGVLDRTHLRFFTRKSMHQLFEQTGYRVKTTEGINGIKLPWKFSLLNRLALGALDDTKYPQFACVAQIAKEAPKK